MKIKIANKVFEITEDQLKDSPEEIVIPFEGVIRNTKEEEDIRSSLHKAGLENGIKQYREEYGFEGRTIDKLIEAVKKKAVEESNVAPNEKIDNMSKALEAKDLALKRALEQNDTLSKEYKSYKENSIIKEKTRALLPENSLLSQEDMMLILGSKTKLSLSEQGTIVGLDANGDVITDKVTGNPESHENIINSFFQNNQQYLKPIEGGSGQGDSKPSGGTMTTDQFIDKLQSSENPIYAGSPEFDAQYNEAVKSGIIKDD